MLAAERTAEQVSRDTQPQHAGILSDGKHQVKVKK